ncbi:MAG: hypothetical protein HGN29_00845 [Asgard group archaeon]|nr:hypothetical protein [Asgard group archaeon]
MENEITLKKRIGYIALKSFIFMVLFAILHFLYTLSPNPFFQIISGTDESVFQHLKMGFIGYLLLIGIDYLIIRKRIENKQSFVFSRLISSLLVPWIIFIIWYLVPAFVGDHLPLARELTWALVVVLLTGVSVSLIDENTERIEYNLAIKIVIGILIVVSLIIFIWFSFELPWIDVFVLPE